MANILYIDFESSPNIGYTWGKYEQTVNEFIQESYLLCLSYAWNDGKVKVVSLKDLEGYQPHSTDDSKLVKIAWDLFNEADIIIAHNAKGFDIKYINGRFLAHGLTPPSGYQVIDTLAIARSKFKLNSNKLDDLGKTLKLGRKLQTGGFDLWLGCMRGDMTAWKQMCKYNKQDVVLLPEVYYRLRVWMNNHPNLNVIDREERPSCGVCQSKHVQKKGIEVKGNSQYQRWKCQSCGANLYTSLAGKLPLRNR